MYKQGITFLKLISFVFQLFGCYTLTTVDLTSESIEDYDAKDIASVVTKDNQIYEFGKFDIKPKPQIKDTLLMGWSEKNKTEDTYSLSEVSIPLSNIKTLQVEEKNTGTVFWICTALSVGGLIAVIAMADFHFNPTDLSNFKYRGY